MASYCKKCAKKASSKIFKCFSEGAFTAPIVLRKILYNEEIFKKKKWCVGEEFGTCSVYRYTETGSETLKKTLAERHLRCCGSVTYWYGSDPDPAFFASG
jgi:hypothetical protein